MNKCFIFTALIAFSGILGGSFAQTGVINDKMASNPTIKYDVPGGGVLALNGYYEVKVTLYRRDVKGLLWATGVKYTGKTITVQGFMKDIDGDFDYNNGLGFVKHTRPGGVIDWVAYTQQPYIYADLWYIPVNARDKQQYVNLRPQARVNCPNINPFGDIRVEGPWTFKGYQDVSNGQVIWANPSVANWQLTDFPNIAW